LVTFQTVPRVRVRVGVSILVRVGVRILVKLRLEVKKIRSRLGVNETQNR
jgi:hypothetical protein